MAEIINTRIPCRTELVYYRFKVGDTVHRVKRAVSYNGETTPFIASGPYKVIGVDVSVRAEKITRLCYLDAGGTTLEDDLFYTEQAAVAEAYLRNQKDAVEHES